MFSAIVSESPLAGTRTLKRPQPRVVVGNAAFEALRSAMIAAVIALALAMPAASAAAAGPFTPLSGSWSGAGTITMASGTRERIRCRAQYDVGGAGANVDLKLRCASDSYKFELQSNVSHRDGALTGTWAELTRRVGGTVEGSLRGSRMNVRVSGTLSALIAINTNANKQSISIESPGSELEAVAISLSRR